jgi:hypothetical protein
MNELPDPLAGRADAPEGRLLASATSPGRSRECLARAIEERLDWGELLRMAAVNQVSHQVAVTLKSETGTAGLPADVRGRLTDLARQALVLDRIHVSALAEIVERFDRAGLPLMVLKGLGLAERLYPSACERIGCDVDLMVPAGIVERAGEILESIGYQPVRKEYYGREHFHIPYRRGHGPLTTTAELHWHVVKRESPVRFDVDRWWREAVPETLRAGRVLVPPRTEELAYLCHHAFLDGAVTLRGLADVARWTARYGRDLDWDETSSRAASGGALGFTHQALALCAALWRTDADGPDRLAKAPRARRWLARNLVHPATIVQAGAATWWPFRRLCYWSMLDPSASSAWELVSESVRGARFTESRRRGRLSRAGRVVGSLALAVVLCAMPYRAFPARFRGRHDGDA